MATWPLAFCFSHPVIGNGFLAAVQIHGRLLAEVESEGVWLYGVNPGAIAASGRTLADANRAIGTTLARVLFDMAAEAPSFDAFKATVVAFFEQTDEDLAAWTEAVARIRSGETRDLPSDLPRLDDPLVQVRVEARRRIDDLRPTDNPDTSQLSAVA